MALVACGAVAGTPHLQEAPLRAPQAPAPIWVLAPHPDDEALMAAHVIATAVRQDRPVVVHLMTNGDLGCERNGYARQRETIRAMHVLGLREPRVRFLGYPDGALDRLHTNPLPPRPRTRVDGTCGEGSTTYAIHGEHGLDVHTARTGSPGAYTVTNAIDDLVHLLERDRPSDIYVSHPIDAHPDHAMTYILLRRALERARVELPRLHRAIVHAGGCWPNGSTPREPCPDAGDSFGTPYPPLPEALARYTPSERLPVLDGGALARRAISEYRSQLHTDVDHDWLGDFARGESIYWTETLMRHGGRVVRRPAHTNRSPPRARFAASVPRGGVGSVHLFASDDDPGRGWIVELSDHDVEVRRASGRVLRRIYVAESMHASRVFELRFDPRPDEGGVVEIELRLDEVLMAILVDPEPLELGSELRVAGPITVDSIAVDTSEHE